MDWLWALCFSIGGNRLFYSLLTKTLNLNRSAPLILRKARHFYVDKYRFYHYRRSLKKYYPLLSAAHQKQIWWWRTAGKSALQLHFKGLKNCQRDTVKNASFKFDSAHFSKQFAFPNNLLSVSKNCRKTFAITATNMSITV